jgi:hypothetical protein
MIRDWHPACRLKPASSAVPATSAKEENKKNNDYNRLGIHDVKPFQYDGFGLGFSTISAFARMPSPSLGTSSGEMPRPGRHSLIARSKQLARVFTVKRGIGDLMTLKEDTLEAENSFLRLFRPPTRSAHIIPIYRCSPAF